jgi:ppGpp synthetase/RelA/SpoT-type nucleotidyltranferase
MSGPSRSQVNRAGRVLRRSATGEPVAPDRYRDALEVLIQHRAAHRVPLAKATMGLRSFVRSEQCEIEVSQRLKRLPTIVDKLCRQPTMQLASMQDIGGCRAVLTSIDEVRGVQRRLTRARTPLRTFDYIDEPRRSGYRGVHVVVEYDDRPVEVQLRTQVMHAWAITVERLGGRLGEDLTSGRGPRAILELLEAVADLMALEEEGGAPGVATLERLRELRTAALPFLGGDDR